MARIDCPKCRGGMREWESRGVTLDHCESCKGLWFDEGELTRHFANLGSAVSEEHLEANRQTRLSCPRCDGARLIEAELGSVRVETCQRCHGIFLDLGEVHELLGAINRERYADDRSTIGFDNFALGLFIGANLGASR